MSTSRRITWVLAIVAVAAGTGLANWADSFDSGTIGASWKFYCYPQVAGTFTQTAKTGAEGNPYLAITETTSVAQGGAAFGVGFGGTEEFTDVRVAATVNVMGDASHNYCGLAARSSYMLNVPGAYPGIVASCYVMHINWQYGPGNLRIDIEKVVNLENMMESGYGEVIVPRLDNARSYYAALDVVGSGPVYITGSLYESKGGPLVCQATLVDTNGRDAWEDAGKQDQPFLKGPSGIFAQNERDEPEYAGFYCTFDDIISASNGAPATSPSPANGATQVATFPKLTWVEPAFATGRQLWFGKAGEMQMVDPAPTGKTFDPSMLEYGQVYEWRVDVTGAGGVVATGYPWTFTTANYRIIDDFELYADNAQIAAAWPHNIPGGYNYIFLETATKNQGANGMRFELQNQYDPNFTEITRTFDPVQDWTLTNPDTLSLTFRGVWENVEQPMYVRLEDAAGNAATVAHPFEFAIQSETWRNWDVPLAEFTGVDMKAVKKLVIRVGDGTSSGQKGEDVDTLYIDDIRLSFTQAAE